MSETIEPPIPLPPAVPPAGLPSVPELPAKSTTQAGAIITIIGGAVTILAVFLPAFSLFDGVNYQYWPMTNTPDASFFVPVGFVVALLGVVRLFHDHMAVRVLVILIALYTLKTTIADADYLSAYAFNHLAQSGITLTYGPALFMFGVSAVAALVGSALPHTPRNR